jgi:hypothetical protein
VLEPDEMVVIYTKQSTSGTVWTNSLLYNPPTKNISP